MAKYNELVVDKCGECGRDFGGIKTFEGFMARLLIACVDIADKDGIVLAKNLVNKGQYARIADLKYWRFLEQDKEWNHYGKYQITSFAFKFLNGEQKIPSAAYVYNGKALRYSSDRVFLKDVLGKKYYEIADWLSDWRNDVNTDKNQEVKDEMSRL